jgi:phosphoribosylformylglycinamidine synthase
MQAGGIGYGKLDQAIKKETKKVIKLSFLERIIELEWVSCCFICRYRTFGSGIELNAIQRSNRNAKRANAIRGLVEITTNCFYS